MDHIYNNGIIISKPYTIPYLRIHKKSIKLNSVLSTLKQVEKIRENNQYNFYYFNYQVSNQYQIIDNFKIIKYQQIIYPKEIHYYSTTQKELYKYDEISGISKDKLDLSKYSFILKGIQGNFFNHSHFFYKSDGFNNIPTNDEFILAPRRDDFINYKYISENDQLDKISMYVYPLYEDYKRTIITLPSKSKHIVSFFSNQSIYDTIIKFLNLMKRTHKVTIMIAYNIGFFAGSYACINDIYIKIHSVTHYIYSYTIIVFYVHNDNSNFVFLNNQILKVK